MRKLRHREIKVTHPKFCSSVSKPWGQFQVGCLAPESVFLTIALYSPERYRVPKLQ